MLTLGAALRLLIALRRREPEPVLLVYAAAMLLPALLYFALLALTR